MRPPAPRTPLPGPTLRLATSSGQREPDWGPALEQYPHLAHWMAELRDIWNQRQRPAATADTGPRIGLSGQTSRGCSLRDGSKWTTGT
jgi:hypothetical protein